MKTTITLLGLFGATLLGVAQTNTVSEITNTISKSPEQIRAEKLAAVRQAMPTYFKLEAADYGTRISSQLSEDIISRDADSKIGISVSCVTSSPTEIPTTVYFQLLSRGQVSNFTDGLDYPIAADGKQISVKLQKITSNDDSSSAVESLSEQVTLENFKTLAWASHVWFKTDHGFVEVPASARQKWKLMWNYYDLLKADASNTESKP